MTYGQNALGAKSNLGVGYSILTGNARQLGYVPYVGDGTAVASTVGPSTILFTLIPVETDTHAQVHVADAVPFITKIIGVAGTEKPQGSAYSRFYITHGERVAWKDLGKPLAKVLHAKGLIASPEPKRVSLEDAGEGEVKHLIGANMLVKGDRAARMGFKATKPSIVVELQKDLAEHDF